MIITLKKLTHRGRCTGSLCMMTNRRG